MTVPYAPPLIARLLRGMSDASLRAASPATFQLWPAKKIVKSAIVIELIANETARRRTV